MNLKSLFVFMFGVFGLSAALAEEPVNYQTDVVPILRQYCAGCHNQDDWEGGLSVETFADLMEGGDTRVAVKSRKPDVSYMMQTIRGEKKPVMPPIEEPQLDPEMVEVLNRWIAEGAKGPEGEDVSILSTLVTPDIAAAKEAQSPITAMAISPDGKVRALARYAEVEIGKKRLKGHPGKVTDLSFTPDGKRLVSATGVAGVRGEAWLWDVKTGKHLRAFEGAHRDLVYAVAVSPDGKMVATGGYDRRIWLWDIETGKTIRPLNGHNGAVYDLVFSPDGKVVASAGGDSAVKVWQVSSGTLLDTMGQPEGEQFLVAFAPDGKHILAAGADKRIRMWRWASQDSMKINPLMISRYAHENEVVAFAFGKNALASASADGTIKRWSLPGLAVERVINKVEGQVTGIGFDGKDGQLWTARLDGSVGKLEWPAVPDDTKPATEKPKEPKATVEVTPNDGALEEAKVKGVLGLPVSIKGTIGEAGEADIYRFVAKAEATWIFEINASRSKSPLDTKVAILDTDGEPVLRKRLQAVRESWLTFRGKNSTTSDDFRVHNWRRMNLNELLYVNGEVVKLWHYPRGPDSGFMVYPGAGNRHQFFDTSARSHPLGQPAYIVEEVSADEAVVPNGLPVFSVYYENDDQSTQAWGKDSRLFFTAPADGEYQVRVEDVRGFGGTNFHYTLVARVPKPDYKVRRYGFKDGLREGTGSEYNVIVDRLDGFKGAVRVTHGELPEGFWSTGDLVIEAGQREALGAIYKRPGATNSTLKVPVMASAEIDGQTVKKKAADFSGFDIKPKPKYTVRIVGLDGKPLPEEEGAPTLTVAPGETISAKVVAERDGYTGRIDFGKHTAGRNLPFGCYVDNIGLNGLMIPAGKNEQTFFITADLVTAECERMFHLRGSQESGVVTQPVRIRVKR